MIKSKITSSLFLLWLLALLPAAAQDATTPLPQDPAVTIGTLANGLTYYIRQNKEPENRVTLRLAVRAGSLQESDDQQGLAHFLEHMAFNGTTHFKKQELVDYLEKIGTRFGADLNASTWFENTVYKLQVPTDDETILNQAFLIMEDWAQGILLEPEEIEKERGVVIEEWRGDRGAMARIRDKQLPKLFHDSQYAKRLPIGLVEVLKNAPVEAFQRFYKDWYRPNLMAVVVVGDMDPAQAVRLIEKHFAQLKNPEGAPERVDFPVPSHDQTLFSINTDPELTSSTIDIYHKRPATPVLTVGDYRQNMVHSLAQSILNSRLNEASREANPPFISGYSFRTNIVSSLEAHVQGAMVRGDNFQEALFALFKEIRRAQKFGYTSTELERQKKDMLRSLEQAYKERDKTQSVYLARSYVDHFTGGDPIPGIENMRDLARKFLPSITLEEVNATSAKMADTNRAVFLSAPAKEGMVIPSEKDILTMIAKTDDIVITPYEDKVSDAPLLEEKPTPGKLVSEKKLDELNIWEWTLANGARIILKPTDFKNDEILFSAFTDGGTSLVDDGSYIPAATASMLVQQSGLGPFGAIELEKKLAGKNLSLSPSIGELGESFSGSASPEDLETMLQLLNLYFSSPRIDDDIFASITTRYASFLENRQASPEVVFGDKVSELLMGGHPRSLPFDKKALAKMDAARSLAIFKERFNNGGHFTYLLVGNFKPEEIKNLVETYLGGLPTQGEPDKWRDVGLKYTTGIHQLDVKKGLEPKASVRIIFTGDVAWSPQQRYHFLSLNQALNIRLREILREDMGGVYGVSVNGSLNRWPQQRFVGSINFGCDPSMVDSLVKAALAELDRLSREGLEETYLEKVKETQLRSFEENSRLNGFWLRNLSFYYRNGMDPNDILHYTEKVATLKAEDLRTAVGTFYSGKNRIVAVLKPDDSSAAEAPAKE